MWDDEEWCRTAIISDEKVHQLYLVASANNDFQLRDRVRELRQGPFGDDWAVTWIHVAAAEGHVDMVKSLIDEFYQETFSPCLDTNENTPLHTACMFGQEEVVNFLLDFDQDDEFHQGNIELVTPFMIACHKRHIGVIELLLEKTDEPALFGDLDQNTLRWYLYTRSDPHDLYYLENQDIAEMNVSLIEAFKENPNRVTHRLGMELGVSGTCFFLFFFFSFLFFSFLFFFFFFFGRLVVNFFLFYAFHFSAEGGGLLWTRSVSLRWVPGARKDAAVG